MSSQLELIGAVMDQVTGDGFDVYVLTTPGSPGVMVTVWDDTREISATGLFGLEAARAFRDRLDQSLAHASLQPETNNPRGDT